MKDAGEFAGAAVRGGDGGARPLDPVIAVALFWLAWKATSRRGLAGAQTLPSVGKGDELELDVELDGGHNKGHEGRDDGHGDRGGLAPEADWTQDWTQDFEAGPAAGARSVDVFDDPYEPPPERFGVAVQAMLSGGTACAGKLEMRLVQKQVGLAACSSDGQASTAPGVAREVGGVGVDEKKGKARPPEPSGAASQAARADLARHEERSEKLEQEEVAVERQNPRGSMERKGEANEQNWEADWFRRYGQLVGFYIDRSLSGAATDSERSSAEKAKLALQLLERRAQLQDGNTKAEAEGDEEEGREARHGRRLSGCRAASVLCPWEAPPT